MPRVGDGAVLSAREVAVDALVAVLEAAPRGPVRARAGTFLDAALASGYVIPTAEVLYSDQKGPWGELCAVLPALGWKVAVRWVDGISDGPDVIWVPAGATDDEVEVEAVPEILPDWGTRAGDLLLYPAREPAPEGEDAPERTARRFPSVRELVAALGEKAS